LRTRPTGLLIVTAVTDWSMRIFLERAYVNIFTVLRPLWWPKSKTDWSLFVLVQKLKSNLVLGFKIYNLLLKVGLLTVNSVCWSAFIVVPYYVGMLWFEFGCRFYRCCHFLLPFLPVAVFTCCRFFRCPFYRCRFYRCRFYRLPGPRNRPKM